jgi:hypothetical protein
MNAINFKATWVSKFDDKNTEIETFALWNMHILLPNITSMSLQMAKTLSDC